jgi:cell division GTPase FtsZ
MRHERRPIREERAFVPGPTVEAEESLPGSVKDWSQGSTRYAWIGAGQCGGRLVKSFYDLGYRKVLAVDTSGRDLALLDLPESQKFLLGAGRDRHAAPDAEETARVLQQHRQDILHLARRIFAAQVDRLMICCGAGGRTGAGSILELIETAQRYVRYIGTKCPSRNVGVMMALPDAGELRSARVARNAYRVAATLCQMAAAGEISPLILVDNQKVGQIPRGMTRPSFWSGLNGTVASLFDTFNRLSSLSSPYTCFDPADYDRIMSSGGCLIMGAAHVDRLDDPLAISRAVADSLQTTLFAGGDDLSTAQAAGCVVVGGHELMAHVRGLQDNIDYAFDMLSEVTGQAISYRGIYEDETDSLRVYTILGGLGIPQARLTELDVASRSGPEPVHTPQQRQDDLLSWAERFLAEQAAAHRGRVKTFSPDLQTLLVNYSWPGGGPELADAIQHAYEAAEGAQIPPEALPFEILFADSELYGEPAWPTLDQVKQRLASNAYHEFLRSLEW